MISCNECDDIFKYRNAKSNLKEHYNNFHSRPKWNRNETIQLNAVHQITLILKRGKSWKTMLKDRIKRKDEGGITSIHQLEDFEKKYNIKFNYKNEELEFTQDPCRVCGKNIKRHSINKSFECYLKLPEHQPTKIIKGNA